MDTNFKKGNRIAEIYEAAKEAWVISEEKRNAIEYVIVENKGVVIAMFKLTEWYAVDDGKWIKENKKIKWGFKGTSVNNREFMNKKLPPKPNMQTQRRYCMDGETINGIDLASW